MTSREVNIQSNGGSVSLYLAFRFYEGTLRESFISEFSRKGEEMNEWLWAGIVIVFSWVAYQFGYYRGFNDGEAPWIWSHSSVTKVKTE